MKKIFIGAIFILLNFNINIGSGSVGLLPDSAGFFLVWKGLTELVTGDKRLEEMSAFARKVLLVLAVATGVEYVLAIFGMSLFAAEKYVYSIIWSVLLIGFECYAWRIVVTIIQNLEMAYAKEFNGKMLSAAWWFYMITNALVTVGSWNSDSFLVYAVAFNIVSMVNFLIQLFKCQKLFGQK
ncbi:MAG: hypothetical protein IJZ85_09660 [Lachnospiraceae bacterium]|nr:hypothetical protein [Lachnospiraceae bacterium]